MRKSLALGLSFLSSALSKAREKIWFLANIWKKGEYTWTYCLHFFFPLPDSRMFEGELSQARSALLPVRDRNGPDDTFT